MPRFILSSHIRKSPSGRPYLQSNKCHCCDAQQGVRGVEVRDGDGQLQAVALEGGGEAEDDADGREDV